MTSLHTYSASERAAAYLGITLDQFNDLVALHGLKPDGTANGDTDCHTWHYATIRELENSPHYAAIRREGK